MHIFILRFSFATSLRCKTPLPGAGWSLNSTPRSWSAFFIYLQRAVRNEDPLQSRRVEKSQFEKELQPAVLNLNPLQRRSGENLKNWIRHRLASRDFRPCFSPFLIVFVVHRRFIIYQLLFFDRLFYNLIVVFVKFQIVHHVVPAWVFFGSEWKESVRRIRSFKTIF